MSTRTPLQTPFRGQNGTLEVADTLSSAVPMEDLKSIKYEPVSLNTGDILVFDGLVPHQSGPNATTKPRVGMYGCSVFAVLPPTHLLNRDAWWFQVPHLH